MESYKRLTQKNKVGSASYRRLTKKNRFRRRSWPLRRLFRAGCSRGGELNTLQMAKRRRESAACSRDATASLREIAALCPLQQAVATTRLPRTLHGRKWSQDDSTTKISRARQ